MEAAAFCDDCFGEIQASRWVFALRSFGSGQEGRILDFNFGSVVMADGVLLFRSGGDEPSLRGGGGVHCFTWPKCLRADGIGVAFPRVRWNLCWKVEMVRGFASLAAPHWFARSHVADRGGGWVDHWRSASGMMICAPTLEEFLLGSGAPPSVVGGGSSVGYGSAGCWRREVVAGDDLMAVMVMVVVLRWA